MKICADCKHSEKDTLNILKCGAPKNMARDIVTGDLRRRYNYCEFLRRGGWVDCRLSNTRGKEGRWFKPKEKQQPLPLDF